MGAAIKLIFVGLWISFTIGVQTKVHFDVFAL
jgi:hypothetical protein